VELLERGGANPRAESFASRAGYFQRIEGGSKQPPARIPGFPIGIGIGLAIGMDCRIPVDGERDPDRDHDPGKNAENPEPPNGRAFLNLTAGAGGLP